MLKNTGGKLQTQGILLLPECGHPCLDFPFSFSMPGILAQHVAEVEQKSDAISA